MSKSWLRAVAPFGILGAWLLHSALFSPARFIPPVFAQTPASSQVGQTGQPPRDNSVRIATAVRRGRVFAADSGQPLRKAQVRIFSPELRENRMATTDEQ